MYDYISNYFFCVVFAWEAGFKMYALSPAKKPGANSTVLLLPSALFSMHALLSDHELMDSSSERLERNEQVVFGARCCEILLGKKSAHPGPSKHRIDSARFWGVLLKIVEWSAFY